MSDLVFYTNPQSRGRIVRRMLEECGQPYETRVLQYGPEMKTGAYASINPMGKVPAITHKGKVVTECPAIIAYLAEALPEAGLAPRPEERADYYRWMFFAAGPLEAAITNRTLGFQVPEERKGFIGYGSYELVVKTLADAISRYPYIAGDRFTAADVYVGSHVGFGLAFGTLEANDAFNSYWERLNSRPAWLQAEALDNALMPKPS
jgi:glutathione S-transferase